MLDYLRTNYIAVTAEELQIGDEWISKLVPAGARPTLPAGAHLLGVAEDDGLSRRVRALLRYASSPAQAEGLKRANASRPLRAALCLCLCAAAAPLLTHTEVLRVTHEAIEHVVEHMR